jgi:uncharacterized protein YheU (UPF0270 family)
LIDLTLTKIDTFLVIVDKGREKSHKDRKVTKIKSQVAKGEKDIVWGEKLKLSTQVGGASS